MADSALRFDENGDCVAGMAVCQDCGEPMEYGEQPTISQGEIGHRVVWTCLNEKCQGQRADGGTDG